MDGKKEFRKYSCLTLNKGMLLWFLVVRVVKTLGIIGMLILFKLRGMFIFFKFEKQA